MTPTGTVRMRVGGHQRPDSLCDAIDTLLDTGVVVSGTIRIRVADVDLIYVALEVMASSWDIARGIEE